MSSRENSLLLREIREPVWSYIVDSVCSLFSARIVLPVLARYLRKEDSVISMKRKGGFS